MFHDTKTSGCDIFTFVNLSSLTPQTPSILQKCSRSAHLYHLPAKFNRPQTSCSTTSHQMTLSEKTNASPPTFTSTNYESCLIRPQHVKFSVSYEDVVVRSWESKDRTACIALVATVLKELGVPFDPCTTDNDILHVEEEFKRGELWVVEDTKTSTIVGTAGFKALPRKGPGAITIRKFYLNKLFRGRGLGSFLLCALEQRAMQMGYTTAFIETISWLEEANNLYLAKGYRTTFGNEAPRSDIIFEKQLRPIDLSLVEDFVEAVDSTAGWNVAYITRMRAQKHCILFRAVAVLLESRGRIFVHTRSMKKLTYPDRNSVLITGVVKYLENPLQTARREVEEEFGLSNLEYSQPFEPFCPSGSWSSGQRILFHPFVAEGDFSEDDICLNLNEVEKGEFMAREEMITSKIGGSLWREFCARQVSL